MLSGQLAPIMDRIGRVYSDFSPHLIQNVNNFNSEIMSQPARTEERKRNRRRRERDRQTNRSQENRSESELEEFDDGKPSLSTKFMSLELSNSSESFSRGSHLSGNREDRENNENGSEIRTRLRSISNTISRIRSSISSMRSLIFSNLGRGEQAQQNDNDLRIDERGERRMTMNAQIPIISSPGDIASVHNIFDRFVDRQMFNIMGGAAGEGGNRNRNRPEQAANNNNESNNASNNNSGSDSNNPNSEHRNRRNQTNQANQASNNENNDLFGEGSGLGLLGSAFGGLGALGGLGGINNASDTIELHIHAFMPNRNTNDNSDGQNNQANQRVEFGGQSDNLRDLGSLLRSNNRNAENRRESNDSHSSENSESQSTPRFEEKASQTENT
jgi:hypothetical protein